MRREERTGWMMAIKKQFPDVRVLVVERQAQNTSLYRFALEDMGFGKIMFAVNTEEALDQMYFNGPSLIILGDELYPKSLLDFMDDIRSGQTALAKDVPVVVIATKGTKNVIEKARDCGVTEIVSMPISAKSLRLRVLAALKTSREFIDRQAYRGPDRRRRQVSGKNSNRRINDRIGDHIEI